MYMERAPLQTLMHYGLAFGVTTGQHPSRGHHTVPPEEPLGSSI